MIGQGGRPSAACPVFNVKPSNKEKLRPFFSLFDQFHPSKTALIAPSATVTGSVNNVSHFAPKQPSPTTGRTVPHKTTGHLWLPETPSAV